MGYESYANAANHIGQKIKVTDGSNLYSKPKSFKGLYKPGDILTVKSFSKSHLEYASGFHIKEVNEFPTPDGVEVIILPNEYEALN